MESNGQASQTATHRKLKAQTTTVTQHRYRRKRMSAAIDAAAATFAKNHPGIMQTSAEKLLKILGNIETYPSEARYRRLKPTNKVMAEKVLPAKGARALLRAVGFDQADGQLELLMPDSAVHPELLAAAMAHLQRLMVEKREREHRERQAAVAKNRAASAKMKTTQEEERSRKAALNATIKQQQEYDRMEEQAAAVAAADPTGGRPAATPLLQQLYTGQTTAGRQTSDGMITVRIVSPDGQDNVQLPARATFGELRSLIAAQLGVPAERQVLGLDRGCTDVVASDRTTLSAKGISNGSFVGLKYPGFVRMGKEGFRSTVPVAETHVKARGGKGSLREEMQRSGKMGITLGEFEALQAERCLVVKQVQTEDAACGTVNCDRGSLDTFQRYVGDLLQYSCKRCALLYGTWTEEGGVEVDALYEPAQENTPEEINIAESADEIAQVDGVAANLGLERVGWIFFRPERDYLFSTNEVLVAATLQNEAVAKAGEGHVRLQEELASAWGPEKAAVQKQLPAAEAAAAQGKRFVTIQVHARRDDGMGIWQVEMQPYQTSERCMELAAAGKFHQSHADPSKAKASKPHFFLVEGKEAPTIDLEFFLVNIPLKHDHTSVLASAFAQANRLDKTQESDVRTYFNARARDAAVSTWSDFNLLVFAARSGSIAPADMSAILTAVRHQSPLPPDVAHRAQAALDGGGGGGVGSATAMDVIDAPRVPPSGGGRWAGEVTQLTAMGFEREAASAVLEATNGNLQQAIAILTT